ncbi:MAG: FAD-binding oxidoreductase, partial [Desulfobacteraceae bacterium]|nr:FAD-binding oxidoreductase [Desulfobacteraceae bacterium]
MKTKKTPHTPLWHQSEPEEKSFRSIFKWGAANKFKNPGQGFFNVIKQELGLLDADFKTPVNLGNRVVENGLETTIDPVDILKLEKIVGKNNIFFDSR